MLRKRSPRHGQCSDWFVPIHHPMTTSCLSAQKNRTACFPALMSVKRGDCRCSDGEETPSGRTCSRTSATACYAASNFFPAQAAYTKQDKAPITLGGPLRPTTSSHRATLNYEDHSPLPDALPI